MKKLTKRLLSSLVALMMLVALLPVSAFAANAVAQIGDTTYETLAAAVKAATDGDTVTLLADTQEDITITKAITLDLGGYTLTGTGSNKVIIVSAPGSNISIKDGTITGGSTSAGGGALYIHNETGEEVQTVTLDKLTITKNSANNGGAICIEYNSNVTINDCTITQNTASGNGGAIDLDSPGDYNTTCTITGNTVISNNTATSNGGAIQMSGSTYTTNGGTTTLTIENATISDNTASNNGGAIAVSGTSSRFVMNGGTISGNSAAKLGGALHVSPFGVQINGGTISGNTAGTRGGGIYVTYVGYTTDEVPGANTMTIGSNAVITKNSGTYGGGVQIYSKSSAVVTVTVESGAQIYNNEASKAGDDIYLYDKYSTIVLPTVSSGLILDDCEDKIDGWYDDSSSTRWEAHAKDEANNHIVAVAAGSVSGAVQGIIAAHDNEDDKEKTSYPSAEKYILDATGKELSKDDIAAGDTVKYELKSNVPQDLLNYLEAEDAKDPEVVDVTEDEDGFNSGANSGHYYLAFHDVLDSNLTITDGTVKVTVNGKELVAKDDKLYAYDADGNATVEVGSYELNRACTSTDANGNADGTDSLYVQLDLVAIFNAYDENGEAYFEEEDFGTAPIVVTYEAKASDSLKAGKYVNKVWVEYEGGKTTKPEVPVYSYGITIFKYDQSTDEKTGLAGAVFTLTYPNGSAKELTSGKDGYISVEGLDAGTYTLYEKTAPDGYVKSDESLTITLPTDANETTYIAAAHFANSPIPHTGGTGTLLYTVGGIAILCLAGAVFVFSRKKEDK